MPGGTPGPHARHTARAPRCYPRRGRGQLALIRPRRSEVTDWARKYLWDTGDDEMVTCEAGVGCQVSGVRAATWHLTPPLAGAEQSISSIPQARQDIALRIELAVQ